MIPPTSDRQKVAIMKMALIVFLLGVVAGVVGAML